MKDFIVLTEFEDKHVVEVSQISCKNEQDLFNRWAVQLNYPRIGEKSKGKLLDEIEWRFQIDGKSLVRIRKTKSVYSDFFLVNGISIFIYAVEPFMSYSLDKYALFVFYKGADYIYEKVGKSPIEVLLNWAKYLSWHYFSKEERNAIKGKILATETLQCIIESSVWYYESLILGNKLQIYIVKS